MSAETYGAAVELLPMPKAHTLNDRQIDGHACVWCAKQVDTSTGLLLGPRVRVTVARACRWMPRACRRCVGVQAVRVYQLHVRTCARCTHHDYCPDSRALYELALENR